MSTDHLTWKHCCIPFSFRCFCQAATPCQGDLLVGVCRTEIIGEKSTGIDLKRQCIVTWNYVTSGLRQNFIVLLTAEVLEVLPLGVLTVVSSLNFCDLMVFTSSGKEPPATLASMLV